MKCAPNCVSLSTKYSSKFHIDVSVIKTKSLEDFRYNTNELSQSLSVSATKECLLIKSISPRENSLFLPLQIFMLYDH